MDTGFQKFNIIDLEVIEKIFDNEGLGERFVWRIFGSETSVVTKIER